MSSFPVLSSRVRTFFYTRQAHVLERVTLKWGCLFIEAMNHDSNPRIFFLNDAYMLRNNRSKALYLSCPGSDQMWLTFSTVEETSTWFEALSKCLGWNLKDYYCDLQLIGEGANGKVYSAIQRKSGRQVAVKLFKVQSKLNISEMNYSCAFQHYNLVNGIDALMDQGLTALVSPLMSAGDLDKFILKYPNGMPESIAQLIFKQILRGVAFMHDRKIAHRDLKPGNMFCQYTISGGLHIKVGDFGGAAFLPFNKSFPSKPEFTTYPYASPEQAKEMPYGLQSDVFSLGNILFNLLTSRYCFLGRTREEVYANISSGNRVQVCLAHVSRHAKDLLEKMLEMDPIKRITVRVALEHRWLA